MSWISLENLLLWNNKGKDIATCQTCVSYITYLSIWKIDVPIMYEMFNATFE